MKSFLLHAAKDGDMEEIQYILQDFINRTVNENEQTALHLAAKNGHSGIVEELLNNGADPNIQDEDGNTPLHLVCKINQEDIGDNEEAYSAIVDQLLAHSNVDVNLENHRGQAPLLLSLESQQTMIANALIDHGASVTDLMSKGTSALHVLLNENFSDYENQKDLLDKILRHHDIEINQQDEKGWTALHWACYSCPPRALPQLIQHFLDKGARADIQTQENSTALHSLCQRYDGDSFGKDNADAIVDLLLKASPGMLNHQSCEEWTPLGLAINDGNFDIAGKLLDYKEIDVHKKNATEKWTALHSACMVPIERTVSPLQVGVVKKLVAKGADLTARDLDGDTPMHLACLTLGENAANENTWDVAKHLLEQDGDHIHALNNKGLSPVMNAAESDASLNSLFRILTYTGGTILDHPWTLNNKEQEATVPKRKKSSRAVDPPKKQKKMVG